MRPLGILLNEIQKVWHKILSSSVSPVCSRYLQPILTVARGILTWNSFSLLHELLLHLVKNFLMCYHAPLDYGALIPRYYSNKPQWQGFAKIEAIMSAMPLHIATGNYCQSLPAINNGSYFPPSFNPARANIQLCQTANATRRRADLTRSWLSILYCIRYLIVDIYHVKSLLCFGLGWRATLMFTIDFYSFHVSLVLNMSSPLKFFYRKPCSLQACLLRTAWDAFTLFPCPLQAHSATHGIHSLAVSHTADRNVFKFFGKKFEPVSALMWTDMYRQPPKAEQSWITPVQLSCAYGTWMTCSSFQYGVITPYCELIARRLYGRTYVHNDGIWYDQSPEMVQRQSIFLQEETNCAL